LLTQESARPGTRANSLALRHSTKLGANHHSGREAGANVRYGYCSRFAASVNKVL